MQYGVIFMVLCTVSLQAMHPKNFEWCMKYCANSSEECAQLCKELMTQLQQLKEQPTYTIHVTVANQNPTNAPSNGDTSSGIRHDTTIGS